MHYANGREAKIGDVVRGKGSNLKHELVGIVIELTPNIETCNIKIATVGKSPSYAPLMRSVVWVEEGVLKASPSQIEVSPLSEYGATKDFVALSIETGEVLEP